MTSHPLAGRGYLGVAGEGGGEEESRVILSKPKALSCKPLGFHTDLNLVLNILGRILFNSRLNI